MMSLATTQTLVTRLWRGLHVLWIVIAYFVLLAPIAVLILASFDDGSFFRFPPQRLSLRWFEAATVSREYRSALGISSVVAVLAATIAVVAGSLAAYVLVRHRPRGARIIEAILLAPLVLPLIVWAIALMQIYSALSLTGTLTGLVLAHTVITLPYAVRIMHATFERIDPVFEAAATSLGARPFDVARRIIIPLALPGLLTSTAFSLLVSFNDVIVSALIAGGRWMTFPVRLYSQLRGQGVDPTTLAIGAGIIAIILLAAIVGELTMKWSRQV
ncbi:ABC transporter permease [Pleomorphomonas sp. JP5]|uniref:ABC transporter permease n=1 Tax=Pleomorphomonas sp. JP5 TaxID=2942998 RepID=UPI00204461C7|nr:ABC transporter permease [Pleomorphomonas sp. JP5]MCM5556322.1 ABC transporter permease [Pleomorphomonas sp. JP5]